MKPIISLHPEMALFPMVRDLCLYLRIRDADQNPKHEIRNSK